MNYKEMNIFDIASVLQNLIHDDFYFGVVIEDKEYNIKSLEVEPGCIRLEVDKEWVSVK